MITQFCLTVILLQVVLTGSQSTYYNPSTCTYSFVVPQEDAVQTCLQSNEAQFETLNERILDLQRQIQHLQEVKETSGNRTGQTGGQVIPPSLPCYCSNASKITYAFRDCHDVKTVTPDNPSGVYNVDPITGTGPLLEERNADNTTRKYWVVESGGPFKAYCDVKDEYGWTIIMRRKYFNLNFNRTWAEYKQGFGNISNTGEYWLGLEKIYQLTKQPLSTYLLWITLTDETGIPHVISYDEFSINSEAQKYRLQKNKFKSRGIGDNLYDTAEFSTYDQLSKQGYSASAPDKNCIADPGKVGGGGWWFHTSSACGYANLNAKVPYYEGMTTITAVEMKIRPAV